MMRRRRATGDDRGYVAFSAWLTRHPLPEDRPFGASSVRYHVARYCDYLETNPWPQGDPLRDPAARDGALEAYDTYLRAFDAPAETIRLIGLSLYHFYLFLGLPPGAVPDGSTI